MASSPEQDGLGRADGDGSGSVDGERLRHGADAGTQPAAGQGSQAQKQAWWATRRWVIVGAVAALLALAAVAGLGYVVVGFAATQGPGRGKIVEISLAPGCGAQEVAEQLSDGRVVARPWLFTVYANLMGAQNRFRSGTVLLRDDMTPRQLLQRLARGFGRTAVRVTLPEGFNRFDVARRLARWHVVDEQAFLSATQSVKLLEALGVPGPTAEGYLFPDTYEFLDHAKPEAVVAKLVRTGRRRIRKVLAEHPGARALLSLGEQGVVTLASIVEKEAAIARERPRIAGVFLNRLFEPSFRPKRLQADPTVAYGCWVQPGLGSCHQFNGKRVTRSMTGDAANLYNTYRHDGLPPGPISNPGLSSIEAVLAPTKHKEFYFVAAGDGTHRFSETLERHNEAVQVYRRLP